MAENIQDFRPTLLVGLGGTGCRIAAEVQALLNRDGRDSSHRLAILGFDTDAQDIRKLLGKSEMGNRQVVRTSPSLTVWQVLSQDDGSIGKWFVEPEVLTTETRQMWLHDGAGQIRMLSRLAFTQALEDLAVQRSIRRAVEVLTSPADTAGRGVHTGPVNIMIVGTLAGGTGSGMFLQAALHLRDVLTEMGALPEIRGLFLLPDIFVRTKLPLNQVINAQANGYAALRELHGLLLWATDRTRVPVEFEYRKEASLTRDTVPFKSITLIDYENQKGGQLQGGLGAYITMASKVVHARLFTPIGGSTDSKSVNDAPTRHAAAAAGDVNYYAGAGFAAAIYPKDEVLDYLATVYALQILGGEMLVLDNLYREELNAYSARRAARRVGEKRPDLGLSFVTNLEQRAENGQAFFSDLHAAVFRQSEGNDGEIREELSFRTYLDALEKWLIREFWNSDRDLQAIGDVADPPPDGPWEKLDDLSSEVFRTERKLKQWSRAIDTGLGEYPPRLFRNMVADSETIADGVGKPHHLPAYILQGEMHPLAVRYFLYHLLHLIDDREQKLVAEQARVSGERARLAERFDDPSTEHTLETARHKLSELEAKKPIIRWMMRNTKQFGSEFREYARDSRQVLMKFADTSLRSELYRQLRHTVSALLEIYEGFFDEMSRVAEVLEDEADENLGRRGMRRGQSGANIYVYSDQMAKEKMAANLKRVFLGSGSFGGVGRALNEALYARYRANRDASNNDWGSAPAFNVESLFRKQVVDGYCRRELLEKHSGQFSFTATEAIKNEARIHGTDEQEHIEKVIDAVAAQAEVFLRTGSGAGNNVTFWAVSPKNGEQLGTAVLDVMAGKAGTDTLQEPEFPDEELLCFTSLVNLTPRDLIKFSAGDPSDPYSSSVPGAYYRAYREKVDAILDSEREHGPGASKHITPHLDRHWHRPNNFPSFMPEEDRATAQRVFDAFVMGLATKRFEESQVGGRPVLLFRDWRKIGRADERKTLVPSHRYLELLEVMQREFYIVDSIMECAGEWAQDLLAEDGVTRVDDPAQTALYRGLSSPETLFRSAFMFVDPGPDAGETAATVVEHLFTQFRQYVIEQMVRLSADEALDHVEQVIGEQIDGFTRHATFQGLGDDARNNIQAIVDGTFSRLLRGWRDSRAP